MTPHEGSQPRPAKPGPASAADVQRQIRRAAAARGLKRAERVANSQPPRHVAAGKSRGRG
jgi:hypothetical protein